MSIKKAVFKELDRVCKLDAILASNTSTLDINEISSVTSRPSSVVGLHFFAPAHIMKLLEVVRGSHTSGDVLATCMNVGKQMKKVSYKISLIQKQIVNI